MTAPTPEPGWYPIPQTNRQAYWDGFGWVCERVIEAPPARPRTGLTVAAWVVGFIAVFCTLAMFAGPLRTPVAAGGHDPAYLLGRVIGFLIVPGMPWLAFILILRARARRR